MQVSEAMTRDVRVANPDQSISDVARIMADCDIGSLPVGENDRLVGMITDRDIAVRAVAQGRSPDTKVREVMSQEVKYCFEDEDLDSVAYNMGDIQLHRLPVVSRDKRLVGIVALADIANCEGAKPAGQAVCGISTPSGSHSQQQGGQAAQSGASSSRQQSASAPPLQQMGEATQQSPSSEQAQQRSGQSSQQGQEGLSDQQSQSIQRPGGRSAWPSQSSSGRGRQQS